jgi:tetratricopeptide (TPR) repeat protein
MRTSFKALLPATCGALLCLSMPANALIMVMGNQLAHDCFLEAKAGVDPQAAFATCNSALENEPLTPHDRAGTYVNRGAVEIALGRVDDAMNDYNTGLRINPDLADAYVDRAGAFILQKRYDLAMTDVNHGIDLGPSYPFVGYYNRAVAEELTGNFKESYLDYQKTLQLEPKFSLAAEHLKDFTVTRVPASKPSGG